MRLIVVALTLALATAAPAAGAQATVTRLVLYKGGGNATPAGPAVQPPGVNTVSTAPRRSPPATTARWRRIRA